MKILSCKINFLFIFIFNFCLDLSLFADDKDEKYVTHYFCCKCGNSLKKNSDKECYEGHDSICFYTFDNINTNSVVEQECFSGVKAKIGYSWNKVKSYQMRLNIDYFIINASNRRSLNEIRDRIERVHRIKGSISKDDFKFLDIEGAGLFRKGEGIYTITKKLKEEGKHEDAKEFTEFCNYVIKIYGKKPIEVNEKIYRIIKEKSELDDNIFIDGYFYREKRGFIEKDIKNKIQDFRKNENKFTSLCNMFLLNYPGFASLSIIISLYLFLDISDRLFYNNIFIKFYYNNLKKSFLKKIKYNDFVQVEVGIDYDFCKNDAEFKKMYLDFKAKSFFQKFIYRNQYFCNNYKISKDSELKNFYSELSFYKRLRMFSFFTIFSGIFFISNIIKNYKNRKKENAFKEIENNIENKKKALYLDYLNEIKEVYSIESAKLNNKDILLEEKGGLAMKSLFFKASVVTVLAYAIINFFFLSNKNLNNSND